MNRLPLLLVAALTTCFFSLPAAAQSASDTGYKPPSTNYEITEEGNLQNAYAGLGVGFGLPGLVAFQANFATFGGIAPGFYLDFRVSGTVAGKEAFGTGSPMWRNSGEIDLRIGYGSRTIDNHRGVLRDNAGRRIRGRIPGAFGVTPYIGWRGRWGYNVQQIRLGLHVESDTDVEAIFDDGRTARAFKRWAFDFELSYSGGWQKGLGAQIGYDHWLNDFIYLRTELGFAAANKKKFYDRNKVTPGSKNYGPNPFTGESKVSPAEGFWAKLMIGFAFRFRIHDVTERPEVLTGTTRVREHEDKLGDESDREREAARKQQRIDEERAAQKRLLVDDGKLSKDERLVDPEDVEPHTYGTGCQRDADCDDGIFCNGKERCIAGVCQPGRLPDDGIECTQLVCDEEAKEFRFEPMHGLCGDGIFCNGTEICDPEVGCIAGKPVPVDDGDPCTINYCDEEQRRVVTEPIPNCFVSDEENND